MQQFAHSALLQLQHSVQVAHLLLSSLQRRLRAAFSLVSVPVLTLQVWKEDNVTVSTDNRANWHVGVIADIPLMQSLYVQTGLYLQNKGYKEKEGDYELTANPMYLEIPVLASYRYNFGDAAQLQFNVGPYFAYGVGGKIKETDDGDEDKWDCFGDKGADWKRFDCGLQIGAGLTVAKHYYIGAAYEFGFSNIAKNSGDGKLKNRNWMISVGYNF